MVLMGMILKMEEVTQRFGIDISANKSEILYNDRGESNVRLREVSLRGQSMKQVEEFVNLGGVIPSNGKFALDIKKRRA